MRLLATSTEFVVQQDTIGQKILANKLIVHKMSHYSFNKAVESLGVIILANFFVFQACILHRNLLYSLTIYFVFIFYQCEI